MNMPIFKRVDSVFKGSKTLILYWHMCAFEHGEMIQIRVHDNHQAYSCNIRIQTILTLILQDSHLSISRNATCWMMNLLQKTLLRLLVKHYQSNSNSRPVKLK